MERLSTLPCEIPNHLLYEPSNTGEIVHILRNILRGHSQKKLQTPNITRFQTRFNWKSAQRERTAFFNRVTTPHLNRRQEVPSETFAAKLAGKYAL
jgi:hypothetical protein